MLKAASQTRARRAEVISREDFVPNILQMLLELNRDPTTADNLHSHQLAVIFLVLAIGSTVSDDTSGQLSGQRYYALACAAFSLEPLIRESTTATLQALFIMIQYYGLVDRAVSDRRWLVSGIMIRLAHSVSRLLLYQRYDLTHAVFRWVSVRDFSSLAVPLVDEPTPHFRTRSSCLGPRSRGNTASTNPFLGDVLLGRLACALFFHLLS